MTKSSNNFLTLIVLFIFIVIISVLLVFTFNDINQNKKDSFLDFITLKNYLLDVDILTFTSKMHEYQKGMPRLSAFRITNDLKSPIYYFSIPDFNSKLNDLEFFNSADSLFYSNYYQAFEISNQEYRIEAVYNIFSKNDIYNLLRKTTVILFLYFVFLTFLLLYKYSNKNTTAAANYEVPDKTTDIFNFNFTIQKITDELKKSASFDHDLVLVLIGAPGNLIKQNEIEFLDFLNKHFIFQDLIFRYNENIFGVLLPNMDLENGIKKIEKFDETFVNSGSRSLKFSIMYGLSSRNGRLISGNIIIKEARAALSKAIVDKNYPIIGFRPNPALYREYLSKIKT